MYHYSLYDRCVSVGTYGIKLNRGKRFVHIPWSQISGVKETWLGHSRQRHRHYYLVMSDGEVVELMRDGEYAHPEQIIGLIEGYKTETVRN